MKVDPMNRSAANFGEKPAVRQGNWKHCFRSVLLVNCAKTISRLIHLTKLNVKQWRELPQQSFVYVRKVKKRLFGKIGGHGGFRKWVNDGGRSKVAIALQSQLDRFRFACVATMLFNQDASGDTYFSTLFDRTSPPPTRPRRNVVNFQPKKVLQRLTENLLIHD